MSRIIRKCNGYDVQHDKACRNFDAKSGWKGGDDICEGSRCGIETASSKLL